MHRPLILLTNDDGVDSPGLWAAARALARLGEVAVVAPRMQSTGAGRSMPHLSDGRIERRERREDGYTWVAFGVNGTPAQAVDHALLELLPRYPNLVVSGINYGENVGTGITISGTIGAAMEAASFGIPALAVSLQTGIHNHLTHSEEVDFSAAAYFTGYFAQRILDKGLPGDVQILKVEVPTEATPETPWRVTRLAMHRYYVPYSTRKGGLDEEAPLGYRVEVSPEEVPVDSDIYALLYERVVSVTPLTLDMTARYPLQSLEAHLGRG
ncbi:5'/3'-nucleotidase SurE [uncultured Thermanaerothrix sp.]|uniref:5'/3'-nucleotidase SurE n=1 Tax=uncultured Thermanaerothrix sp. TaxID=1195149 RepID=UPI002631B2B1|nr:5'/3'-nucleotidase SurE [uncultured Thermanaerothrix sp.]